MVGVTGKQLNNLYNIVILPNGAYWKDSDGEIPQVQLTWEELVDVCTDFTVKDYRAPFYVDKVDDNGDVIIDEISGLPKQRLVDDKTALGPHMMGVQLAEGATNRQAKSVEYVTLLVLDIDDGASIEVVRAMYPDYRQVGYSSYNHLVAKNGKKPVEKARLIIPFNKPVPLEQWDIIKHYVSTFCPFVDENATKKCAQPFTLPIHRTGQENIVSWSQDGISIDWEEWIEPAKKLYKETVRVNETNAQRTILEGGGGLTEDTVVETANGNIRIGDILGLDTKHSQVRCPRPEHGDRKGGNFMWSTKNRVTLRCGKCGDLILQKEPEDDTTSIADFIKKRAKNVSKNVEPKTNIQNEAVKFVLDVDEGVAEPYSRERRAEILNNKVGELKNHVTIIYGFEGYGKSYQSVQWVRNGKKVLFGTNSNAQTAEQAEDFEKTHGLRVQRIHGREYQLACLGIEVVHDDPKHPWDGGQVNVVETKKNIQEVLKKDKKAVDELWDSLTNDEPDFDNYDIVVTTHARISSWGQRQVARKKKVKVAKFKNHAKAINLGGEYEPIIPEDVYIVFDDPGEGDFTRFINYDEKYVTARIQGELIEQASRTSKTEDGTERHRHYFVKPMVLLHGAGFENNHIVFTTTEIFVHFFVNRHYKDVYTPDLMPTQKMLAGDITLIGTNMVRSKKDGLLPPLVERLNKEGKPVTYIADGAGAEINLVNNKGSNALKNVDTLIEISEPHYSKPQILADELGWNHESDLRVIKFVYMLDKMNQAIGRNSGYRYSDNNEANNKAIVLVEPSYYKEILKYSRYAIGRAVNVEVKARRAKDKHGVGLHANRDELPVEQLVEWLVKYYELYMYEGWHNNRPGIEWVADVKQCLEHGSVTLRRQRANRMRVAIKQIFDPLKDRYAKVNVDLNMKLIKKEELPVALAKTFDEDVKMVNIVGQALDAVNKTLNDLGVATD